MASLLGAWFTTSPAGTWLEGWLMRGSLVLLGMLTGVLGGDWSSTSPVIIADGSPSLLVGWEPLLDAFATGMTFMLSIGKLAGWGAPEEEPRG